MLLLSLHQKRAAGFWCASRRHSSFTFSGTYDGIALKGNISVEGYSIDFIGTKPGAASSLAQVADLAQGDAR